MVSGHEDYYRGIDIAYQELSEQIVRPKYGGAILGPALAEVGALETTSLLEISGKGMIYGGVLWIDYTSTQQDSIVYLWVDGAKLLGFSFENMMRFNIIKPRSYPFTINVYNNIDFVYACGFSYGVTFETSLEITYREMHNTTPSVNVNLVYALI